MAIMNKTTIVLALAALVPVQVLAQGSRPAPRDVTLRRAAYGQSRGAEQTETFSRTFQVGASPVLDLSNITGAVTLTGGGGNEVAVSAVKRARDRERPAAEQLRAVTITAVEGGNRVEVRTVYPRGERHIHVAVDYTVTLPSGATALVRNISGNVSITNVQGEIRTDIISGNVVIRDAGRSIFAKSVSGTVEVAESAPGASITLSTVSGGLVARDVQCRSLEGNTVSGTVKLVDASCDRIAVQSISGTVDYIGALAQNGRYSFKSHSGGVRLALGSDTGFELDASTFSGSVRSDFPVTMKSVEEHGRSPHRAVRGTYGNASALLEITSFSGGIVITRR